MKRSPFPGLALLACLLSAPARAAEAPAPAAAEEAEDEEEGNSLEVGLRGSGGREANTRDLEWGPTLSCGLMSGRMGETSRFKYELELSYNDATSKSRSGDSSQSTRVRRAEFRYAKVSVLELLGFDVKKRIGIVPYFAGGIQHVDSLEDSTSFDEDLGQIASESKRDRYWSPTFGVGAEVALNKKLILALDYDQNVASGDRRVSRLSLELKYAVFGGD